MHIGIIEDNPSIREVLAVAFEMRGHSTALFETAEAFFQHYFPDEGRTHSIPFDAITLDLGLPGTFSGKDILQRLVQEKLPHALPFLVVLSGAAENELHSVHDIVPTLTILRKPFHFPELVHILEKNILYTPSQKKDYDPNV